MQLQDLELKVAIGTGNSYRIKTQIKVPLENQDYYLPTDYKEPLKCRLYVEDILKFKRKFVGQTKNNTFCLVEDNEQNAIVKNYNSIKEYGKIPFEICEYGFIKPNGEYIPVQWCQHLKYANGYIQSNYSIEDQMTIYYKYKNAEDYLIKELCWILIENPHQEMGIIHTGNFITKAQKETLFDYYIFFDRNNEAIELYK